MIYDLFEAATCMRMMHNFFHIKGAVDLPYGWVDKCLDVVIISYQKLMNMKNLLRIIQFFLNE
jgi:NAD(P)H-quinone oxidoreductase subunit H